MREERSSATPLQRPSYGLATSTSAALRRTSLPGILLTSRPTASWIRSATSESIGGDPDDLSVMETSFNRRPHQHSLKSQEIADDLLERVLEGLREKPRSRRSAQKGLFRIVDVH